MEKINKEELMKKIELSEEELEKVTGGVDTECINGCIQKRISGARGCDCHELYSEKYNQCMAEVDAAYTACTHGC